jgi:hypothetical protein
MSSSPSSLRSSIASAIGMRRVCASFALRRSRSLFSPASAAVHTARAHQLLRMETVSYLCYLNLCSSARVAAYFIVLLFVQTFRIIAIEFRMCLIVAGISVTSRVMQRSTAPSEILVEKIFSWLFFFSLIFRVENLFNSSLLHLL